MHTVGIVLGILIIASLFYIILHLITYKKPKAQIPLPTQTVTRYNITYYTREFVQPYTYEIRKKLQELELEDLDELSKIKRIFAYVSNLTLNKTTDTWRLPQETVVFEIGSCVDLALTLASLLIASGIEPERVRVVLGEAKGTLKEGRFYPSINEKALPHAWVICQQKKDNQWLLLDAASNRDEILTIDEFISKECYIPKYMFNNIQEWKV